MRSETGSLNALTGRIIGAAIEVHRVLGPGLRELTYERALSLEFEARRLEFARQVRMPLFYKGAHIGTYRLDFLVEHKVVLEIKCTTAVDLPSHAQVLSYLKRTKCTVGLLMNFHAPKLTDGIRRFIL